MAQHLVCEEDIKLTNSFTNIERKLKEMSITSKYSQRSEQQVVKIEQKYGFSLPLDYRQFLINYGTLNFAEDIVFLPIEKLPDSSEDGYESIINFYGLENDHNDLKRLIERYNGRIPEDIIPIAECPGGNQLCISMNNDFRGKIYFWDHEKEKAQINSLEDLWKNIYLISNSFNELIMSFKIREEDNLDSSKITEIKMNDKFLARLQNKQKG